MATVASQLCLVIALIACIWQAARAEQADVGRCAYAQAQQMFDWARYGPNGCIKLKSLSSIFGLDSEGDQIDPKYHGTRYLTSNLVFIGTVSHVIKKANSPLGDDYKIRVRVHCYLKGRLNLDEIEVVGFRTDKETGLCLSIKCEDGDNGLFFVTYSDGVAHINENGFVREGRELDAVMAALRCRENRDYVTVWPTRLAQSSRQCQADSTADATCRMSLQTSRAFLSFSFIVVEPDLKPECQEGMDFVMRRLIKSPYIPSISFSRLASGNGALGRPAPSPMSILLAVIALTLSLQHLINK